MAKAKDPKSTTKRTKPNPSSKVSSSKVRKSSQVAPQKDPTRKSSREKYPSLKAQEAAANAQPPAQKSKPKPTHKKKDLVENSDAANLISNAKTGLKEVTTGDHVTNTSAGPPKIGSPDGAALPAQKKARMAKTTAFGDGPSRNADAGPPAQVTAVDVPIGSLEQGVRIPRLHQGESHTSVGSKRKRSDLPSMTWEEILDEGLTESRRLYTESTAGLGPEPGSDGFRINTAANMTIDDVWVAIGSIWEGLRSNTAQSPQDAYAGLDLFYPPRTREYCQDPKPAAGTGHRFFMPILFPDKKVVVEAEKPNNAVSGKNTYKGKGKGRAEVEKEEEKSEVGHLLLAVARIVERSGDQSEIQVDIYDNSVDEADVDYKSIGKRAHDLIKRARWPSPKVGAPPPIYRKDIHQKVPQQLLNSDTCGFYTILNAWALMLGIPVFSQHSRRPVYRSHGQFIEDGLVIINMALAGFMSFRTIQAFMNVHGYSKEQSAANAEEAPLEAGAVAMQQVRLMQRLSTQRRVDQGISEEGSVTPDELSPRESSLPVSNE